MKVCKKITLLVFITHALYAQLSISYMRFYANDKDFISDIRLLATHRFDRSHLQVFYDENKTPLLKEWIDEKGGVLKREYLEYKGKNLVRRYYLNNSQSPDSVRYFGKDEPWSQEFRKVLNHQNKSYYDRQETLFVLNQSNQFDIMRFINVQGNPYGEIEFIYNHLGLLVGEVWRLLPKKIIVRKYAYSTDILTGKKEIREFNQNAEQISYMVLSQPPAESLYKTIPPRTGNNLDEISILLEDIRQKDLKIPFDVFIPKTDHDLLVLTNGDSLMVEIVDMRSQQIIFSIAGEEGKLTMPKFRVRAIVSKYGEPIYP
ncbi:MAG: hypothetical protein VX731_01510 [Candidatus Neomarinimicrobiota bacterium]|nr:hypothetical protein [Candidatus Neomarinimicrobiota bacterium]|tara:strand:- start:4073 stop:5020 length:948 start_codon:yes stop_codon:yes gene_type:complete